MASRSKSVNGLGMDGVRLARWIARFQITFEVLPETADLLDRWSSLIATHNITGFQVHDARYVALMQCHGLARLMTYNLRHFATFPITIVDPEKV